MKEATKNLKTLKFIKGFNPAIKQCHCISVKKTNSKDPWVTKAKEN